MGEPSRDFAAARQWLLAAAEEYRAGHAYREASGVLRLALEYWPDAGAGDGGQLGAGQPAGGRLEVIDRLAHCAEMCSEQDEAAALLEELVAGRARQGDLPVLAATYRRLAVVQELRGHWACALAARDSAAKAFDQCGQPAQAATDRLAVAAHQRSAASYNASLATLAVVAANARASGRTDLLLRAEGLRGNVLSRLGEGVRGLAAVRAALADALRADLPDTAAELQQRLADSLEHGGDYEAATRAYGAAYLYCDSHGTDGLGQLCRACATAVLFNRGEWDRALAVCEDVLAGPGAVTHSRAVSACMTGLVHVLRGNSGAARGYLLDAAAVAARIELVAVELLSAWGLCMLDEESGAVSAATGRARQVLDRVNRTQERHYCIPVLQWAATFFASRGLLDDARACAAALSRISEATAQPEAVASLAHALGETLLAENPKAAAGELRKAAETLAGLGLPLAAAHAQVRAASAALVVGDQGPARKLLRAARATADRLGAAQLLAQCDALAARLSDSPREVSSATKPATGSSRAPAPSPVAGLTAREMDVMRLVAAGNTSRQAAAVLFLSPRTVEMHVQGCLLKLGCRTRTEAVRKLAGLGALSS